MLRKKRIGLIIWGAILFFTSLFFLSDGDGRIAAFILLPGGILLLVFGIINVVSVTKHNNILISETPNWQGNCPNCNREVRCSIRDFRPHGRYPEGYIYCPICKKPISKNAFNPYQEN